jgi:hypothetical protein
MEQTIHKALKQLRTDIPDLARLLKLDDETGLASWSNIIDAKLLSRFSPDFPVVAAICGGGSSGKSTLFNSLLGERLAPSGGKAGLNRRLLFSVPAGRAQDSGFVADLVEPYQTAPGPLQRTQDLLNPGKPLYVVHRSEFRNLVLLDTPDFDTGAQGAYTNREVTQKALEASDILIYIFTNSNYNNRDNTDFISRMLTGIGRRKCFLVYRAYPSFTEQEVCEHAMVVARGIYGDQVDNYLLGIYRADEDNRVAAGEKFMELHPVRSGDPTFWEALDRVEAQQLRIELHASILRDVLDRAGRLLESAATSLDALRLYRDALQTAQSHCVHEALKHFPMDRVLRRFFRVWTKTDPSHVKVMRKTGALIELPLKALLGVAGWAKDQVYSASRPSSPAKDFEDRLDENLITAITGMHHQAISSEISVDSTLKDPVAQRMSQTTERVRARRGLTDAQPPRVDASGGDGTRRFVVAAHPGVLSQQERLRNTDFKSILQSILAHRQEIAGISSEMERDLKNLADHFRGKMSLWAKINQTFWAFMNVLPATVAVTYVLSTGDPIGAAGIKIKLTGLFGAKDLYALLAIPATTGMKKADRKQVEVMLAPIVQTWLSDKFKTVQNIFEQYITGDIIRTAEESIAAAEHMAAGVENNLQICLKGATQV